MICHSLTVNGHMRRDKAGASIVRPGITVTTAFDAVTGGDSTVVPTTAAAPVTTKLYVSELEAVIRIESPRS